MSGKNSEAMAEVGKVRIELNQKIEKMETERKTKSELYDQIAKHEKDLSGNNVITLKFCINLIELFSIGTVIKQW